MVEITRIGYIVCKSDILDSEVDGVNYHVSSRIKQINNFLPVEIVLEVVDDTKDQSIAYLVNSYESAIKKFNDNKIKYVILDGTSSILVPLALGKYLNENKNIYLDKIERWGHMKFFCFNNYLSYKGSRFDLLLVVRNLWRFGDISSGQEKEDKIDSFKTNIFKDLKLPKKVYVFEEKDDNAAQQALLDFKEVCNSLGIEIVSILGRYKYEYNEFGGLFELVDYDETTKILNEWIDTVNRGDSVGIGAAIGAKSLGGFTNTIVNTQLQLNPINNKSNKTLYEALNNTEGTNCRFIFINYGYSSVVDFTGKQINEPLKIVQYVQGKYPFIPYNNILARLSGNVPSDFLSAEIGSNYVRNLEALDIINYILADVNGTFPVGIQDCNVRFDHKTQRSRVCQLLQSSNLPANTFENIAYPPLYLNKPFDI